LEPARPVGRPGNIVGWLPPELRRRSHA
jgi:hypothetical protein